MENPFSHNRAMNVIGKVLDGEPERQKLGEPGPSLECLIASKLQEAGLLNEKAFEIVGLEGRGGRDSG